MSVFTPRLAFLRILTSALASQVVLSATSFLLGLFLIRHVDDRQYGAYMLVLGTIVLAVSLQGAFIGPALVNRMARRDVQERRHLTGGLYREQRRLVTRAAVVLFLATLAAWAADLISAATARLLVAAVLAVLATLRREYLRMVLLAYRRAHAALIGDIAYVLVLAAGIGIAVRAAEPAVAATLGVAAAATVAGTVLSRNLYRAEPWDLDGAPGILREIAPLALWSTAGAAIHWSFSQGYVFVVAGALDVGAIAAIAATRLLAMPVNLLSVGIGSLMLPLASRWMVEAGVAVLLRRLSALALGIALIAIAYFGLLWLLRDWLFTELLHRQFAQRDLLLRLWSASFVLMAVHQQLLFLLVVRERFRLLTSLALISATTALACSYLGMQRYGGAGAPLGILVGEAVNTIGIAWLCLRELRSVTAAGPSVAGGA